MKAVPDDGKGSALRVVIVGYGISARLFHVPAMRGMSDMYEVVAVVDPSPECREAAAVDLGLEEAHVCVDLDDVDGFAPDLLDLCTPPSIREHAFRWAAERGIHVLGEKPLATSLLEARRLVELTQRLDVVAMVHNWVYLPEYAALLERIERGDIGDVCFVGINLLGFPELPDNWRRDGQVAGGGILMDLLHVCYVVERLLRTRIRRVTASMTAAAGGAVEDFVSVRFDSDTATAVVNLRWGSGPASILVSGSNGHASVRFQDDVTGAPAEAVTVAVGDERSVITPAPVNVGHGEPFNIGHGEVLRNVHAAICDGSQLRHPIAEGVRALEAALAAYKSAAMGKTVDLPLNADDPVALRGVAGLVELRLDPQSSLVRAGLFGTGPPSGSASDGAN